ncbi:MAG: histidinol dehydrogenase, partial [Actinobacteria bacterium]|nr:histidinol dehydrogenase [Actinomycetota bacterium]
MGSLRVIDWARSDAATRSALFDRGLDDIFNPDLRRDISMLIDNVHDRGDLALCEALARFDDVEVDPDGLRVSDSEWESASVSPEVNHAIDTAITNLKAFNEQQLERSGDWSHEVSPGLVFGEKVTPISSAGLFTPSGKASYPSVTYQLAVPAIVAGVPEIAV